MAVTQSSLTEAADGSPTRQKRDSDSEQRDGETAKRRWLWAGPWYCDDGGLAARRMKPDGLEAKV